VNTRENYDLVIIGAGVIGIAAGIAALESRPSLKVLIVEKSSEIAEHASGRNSGVLHAGFYYSPESLKAQFCRQGNSELKHFARKMDIPIKECGKVVVAKDQKEALRLESLYSRGIANGVDIEIHDESRLIEFEPSARTISKFIWSPTTAVVNPVDILRKLLLQFISMGGSIKFNQDIELKFLQGEISIKTGNEQLDAKYIINAAGAQSDLIARKIGVGKDYLVIPFRGNYRKSHLKSQSRRLVYPVPHEVNPFLGVHTTLTPDGFLKIGPTAMPAFGRENYKGLQGIKISELPRIIHAMTRMAKGTKHDLLEIIRMELPLLFEKQMIKKVEKLLNEDLQDYKWTKSRSGIRSQLVNIRTGDLVQDFVVEKKLNSLHFLNVVSPGWTSALPFTRYFVNEFIP
jgi:L-2-hydroxyglutarate oxidase LhgO